MNKNMKNNASAALQERFSFLNKNIKNNKMSKLNIQIHPFHFVFNGYELDIPVPYLLYRPGSRKTTYRFFFESCGSVPIIILI